MQGFSFWNEVKRNRKMTDQEYMRRAIELAKKGTGWVNPNPLVGAVIVKEGRIIGEGYHARCGDLHAERSAFKNLTESAEGATIYVTLEPCCHYGKQPPCTLAILENKIARVVVGSRDPNPLVSGKGAAMLREAGVVVEEDFLRDECDALNPIFFHFITKKTPYVKMKYAMTADGKIATRTGASKWITGEAAREEVQRMRITCMGIMAGIGTVLADDPMLNVRIPGERSPIRIICDSSLRIPLDAQICRTAKEYPVIVASAFAEDDEAAVEKKKKLEAIGIEVLNVPDGNGQVDLKELMKALGEKKIDSILLEGGGILNDSALRAGIVSEVNVFVAPKLFGGAASKSPVEGLGVEVPADAVMMKLEALERIGDDLLLRYRIRG